MNTKDIINKTLGRIALIVVPLFFALSELTHPITQDTILGEINSAKDNSLKWLISHLFVLVAIIFLPFLINKLISYIDEKKIKTTILGVFLSYAGIIGVTGLLAYDFILWDAWKVGNNEVIGEFLEILNSSTFGILFLSYGPILFILGFIILVLLMMSSANVKRWKTVLVLIGLLIYGLAGPLVPVPNGHILVCIGALIMLTGLIGVLKEDFSQS
ncbi:hypothetical protein [Vallitalea okinawensis]|uniref:hypothetical protein n=1 Tax=Vallitalea okinawensis TaxID=2078660 RepID=UPI000CFC15A6|nr:hypothetical protein [Vallitalea okinawensis]